jgi:hypothetical protein
VEERTLSRTGAADADRPTPVDAGVALATFTRAEGRELRVRWKSFRDHYFLDLREWNRGADGSWWPSAKGVTVRPRELGALLEAVSAAARLAS